MTWPNARLTIIQSVQADDVAAEANRQQIPVYRIQTGDGPGPAAFFSAARRSLPLSPEVLSNDNWDALSDSLWEGLYQLDADQVVVLWQDAGRYRESAPDDYQIAVGVLTDIVETLADPRYTARRPTTVCVYLIR